MPGLIFLTCAAWVDALTRQVRFKIVLQRHRLSLLLVKLALSVPADIQLLLRGLLCEKCQVGALLGPRDR